MRKTSQFLHIICHFIDVDKESGVQKIEGRDDFDEQNDAGFSPQRGIAALRRSAFA